MSLKKICCLLSSTTLVLAVHAESDYSAGFEASGSVSGGFSANAGGSGVDCPECEIARGNQQQAAAQPNSWVEALGLIAGPLSMLGSTWVSSYYGYKTQKTWANTSSNWADAYKSGYEACTNNFNSYLSYLNDRGANPLSSSDATGMVTQCNGNGMSGYAGYGGLYSNGYGGVSNPWLASGYSSGMMSGMMGPYSSGGLYSGTGIGGIGLYAEMAGRYYFNQKWWGQFGLKTEVDSQKTSDSTFNGTVERSGSEFALRIGAIF